ncbi:PTS sugar transporter subunit IIA [Dermatophilus congolensis]|uniref:Glucose-specific phosphotransferase enzyme IIA component n=1 Tax=Dermatophilus congolensis TaxID=1863 RepID=A0AA46BQ73_9MICO|nr:PTS glucose transporter subunit IIA [Dermatophilus congolensis]STD15174.1 Glucose-specific phosphotransferase enzyme IIA component [Dermatophilus congolensis]
MLDLLRKWKRQIVGETHMEPHVAHEALYRPVQGRAVDITEVPDPVFAQKIMGDGFAVLPDEGVFRAPVAGELVLVAETMHAFAIRTDAGAEVLVHIGIDTVGLKGEGFTAHAQAGRWVQAGEPIISCDLRSQEAKVPSMITPVVVTNGDRFTMTGRNLSAANDGAVAVIVSN